MSAPAPGASIPEARRGTGRFIKSVLQKRKSKVPGKMKVRQARGFFPLLCWVFFPAGYKEMLLKRRFKNSLISLFQKSHETALYFTG